MPALHPAVAVAAPSHAARDLKQLRARIEALRQELDAKESQRRDSLSALRDAEQAISDANRALHVLSGRERATQARLSAIALRRRAAVATLKRQQQVLGRLLASRELSPAPDVLRILLSGKDPAKLERQLYYLEQVSRALARFIASVRSTLAELARLKVETEEQAERLVAIEARQRTERDKVVAERAARQKALRKLSARIRDKRQRMQTMLADERRLTQVVNAIGRVLAAQPRPGYARVELVPQRSQRSGPFKRLRGKLRLPVRGELTARFGTPRPDGGPDYKGVFIRAPEGAPVRAVAAGRVVFADWMRGFGNLLIVDHGDGYMSIYADNETLLERTGDAVAAGQVIATVGSTGGRRQSGLYFELRHLGKAFDPLRWVKLK